MNGNRALKSSFVVSLHAFNGEYTKTDTNNLILLIVQIINKETRLLTASFLMRYNLTK